MSPAPASKKPKKQKLAKQNGDELERIKTIGRDLLASRASINNAPLLISIISNSLEDESASEQGLESLLFLQAFFIPLFKSDLSSSAVEKASRRLQRKRTEETAEDETEAKKDAEAVYTNWLKGLYNEYLQLLKKIVLFPTPSYLLRAAALDAIMELVRQEKQGRFQNDLYFSFMNSLISSRKLDEVVVNLLTSKYFMYKDICYFSYSNIGKIVNNFSKHAKGEEMPTDNEDGELSGNCLSLFMNNTLEILLKLPPPQEDSESPMEEIWVFSHGSQCNEETLCHSESKETSNLATEMKRVDMLYAGKFCTKQVRKKMSKAWLTFLRLPLTIDVYKRILVLLHKNVIPYLTNPLLLSDFLTRSYDIGGVISVMALSSLFVLMTQYSLEYPDFYDKLYALLEPSIFMAKYRSRFFELLDTCLKSPLLPAYLAAAFAKKLSRLTLSSPPSGSLVIIALIHNLLRRHPSINCLVHQEVKEEDTTNSPKLEKDNKENNVLSKPGVDPFIHGETNTAKCKALQSSLWEIDTLRIHYSPAVSRFVTSLESDLTVRAKTTEVNVKDFSSGSYNTIFSEEVKRRIKQVPLAFYKSVPSTLFPQRPTEGEGSLAAFPGWNFSVS